MSTHSPTAGGPDGHPVRASGVAAHHAPTLPAQTVPARGPAPNGVPHGAAGTVIGGRYTLVSPIGTGGMGAVWRATDRLLRREVAIKEVVLPSGTPASERDALTERTLREARAAAGLSHPSVVRVYDVVTDDGRPWIVMELLKAHSLAELIERDGPLAGRSVAKIGLAMLGALEAAHAAGVLHRDVKPGNVLICADGRCVLTDFGVARSASDTQMTTPGMVLGSPHFISPERATGGQFGPPSDLFSLGVTLYTAAEGRAPFDRGDAISTMNAVVNDPPEPPRRAGELTPVLYGLLEKDPARRWDVERTRAALRGMLLGASPAAPAATSLLPTATPLPTTPIPVGHPTSPAGPPPVAAANGAESWRVGRATVRSADPVSAPPQPAPAGYPPPPSYPRPVAYPAGPSRMSRMGAWLFGAGAVLVALTMVLTAVGYSSGWFDGDTPPGKKPPAEAKPNFKVRTYHGQGLTLQVPADWKRRNVRGYVQFHDPRDDSNWLRINVTRDGRTPQQILRSSDQNFSRGCCGITNYRQVALRGAKLAGHDGAELEYIATRARNQQQRHGIWRMIVVGGRNYQVYMSVNADRFDDHRQVFDEAVRSMKLAR